jgi:predicted dehydrogenase
MKVLFFGLGSIGKRHLRLLQSAPFARNFEYYHFASRRGSPGQRGVTRVSSWAEVKALKPQVAFICNPTAMHIKTAFKCAEMGMHLFIEKPIGATDVGLMALQKMCRKKRLKAFVAYNLRFAGVIQGLKRELKRHPGRLHVRCTVSSYLPDWRKGTNSRNSYSAQKKMGGGVLLDLSHEFDYLSYLFGDLKFVAGVGGRLTQVTSDAEDFADVLLVGKRATVNLHLNFMSRKSLRQIEIDTSRGRHLTADLIKQELTVLNGSSRKARTRRFPQDRDEIYLAQLRYFFSHLPKRKMMNDLDSAAVIFEKILAIKRGLKWI